jgi:uncharacterized protein (TIGR01655 family)
MKKMLKKLTLILAGLMILLLMAPHLTKNRTGMVAYMLDLMNPFVGVSEVYGIVPDEPVSSWKDDANGGQDYGYTVKTYDKSGKERSVQVTAFGSKLESGTFMKIKTKGQAVRAREDLAESDVPQAILKLMEGK